MEIVLKVAVTAVVVCLIYYQAVFVWTLWKSQIDPTATFARLLSKLKPQSDLIATRELNKIYQRGQAVGEIVGSVETKASSGNK